jgi:hypothetical protein
MGMDNMGIGMGIGVEIEIMIKKNRTGLSM